MEPSQVVELIQQTIWLTIKLSSPIMLIGLFVGLVIALLQALTQVQEITLTFVPKIIAIFFALFFLFPSFVFILSEFTVMLSDMMIGGNIDAQEITPQG